MNSFVTCRASNYVQWWDEYITCTEHNWKLKFSMQSHLTDTNALFEYCHASENLEKDILYLEYGNVYRLVLKNKTATMFFLKIPFSS